MSKFSFELVFGARIPDLGETGGLMFERAERLLTYDITFF